MWIHCSRFCIFSLFFFFLGSPSDSLTCPHGTNSKRSGSKRDWKPTDRADGLGTITPQTAHGVDDGIRHTRKKKLAHERGGGNQKWKTTIKPASNGARVQAAGCSISLQFLQCASRASARTHTHTQPRRWRFIVIKRLQGLRYRLAAHSTRWWSVMIDKCAIIPLRNVARWTCRLACLLFTFAFFCCCCC